MTAEPSMRSLKLKVNGQTKRVMVRNADTLLDTLRERLGLTGAKPGCGNGDCGTCTVLVDGQPINSCQMLAVEAEEAQITTIEGLQNTPIQHAFVDQWAIQCGYCTPGLILTCQGLIEKHPDADDHLIRDWLSSNLCRCTGYEEIEKAVKAVLRGTS